MGKGRPPRRPRPLGASSSPGATRSSSAGRTTVSSPGQRTSADPARKKKRNPIEMALVWGAIGLLCLVVMIELAGRMSYNRALNGLQKAVNDASRSEPFYVKDALKFVNRPPEKGAENVGGGEYDTYEWTWFSFHHTYTIKLQVRPKDQSVITLTTGDNSTQQSAGQVANQDGTQEEQSEK